MVVQLDIIAKHIYMMKIVKNFMEKTYKNIKKDKISKMSQDKKWIRYCLLLMMEGEQTLFEINQKTLDKFYQSQVNLFFERKKRKKKKN